MGNPSKILMAGANSFNPYQQNLQFQQNQQMGFKKELRKELKAPLPDQYRVENPKNISSLELDLIRHVSQFVAKNGQKFLIALTEREKQNPQFDFLKPTHQLFNFFTSLVDAYSKCIAPRKEEIYKLQNNIQDRMSVLKRVGERFEYENLERITKKKKEELDEEERSLIIIFFYYMRQIYI